MAQRRCENQRGERGGEAFHKQAEPSDRFSLMSTVAEGKGVTRMRHVLLEFSAGRPRKSGVEAPGSKK